MKSYPFLFLISILVFSCKTKKTSDFKLYLTDTSVAHTNFNDTGFIKKMCDKLNLPPIYNGVDSFELRIWISSIFTRKDLIIFRYSQNQWSTTKTEYYEKEYKIDSAFTYKIDINGNIGDIVSFLANDSILKLPSQNAIPNFMDNIADGQDCIIEISTRHYYKFLDYHCPEFFADKEPNNKMFMTIIDFLNKHFGFYTPYCKKQY